MVRQHKPYDEDELVEMIAQGQLTYAQIAGQLGISESLIKQIARGHRRPELQRRIWDVENGLVSEARRLGSRFARSLIGEQIRLGLSGKGEPARRAREFVLKFAVSARPKRSELPLEPLAGLGMEAPELEDLEEEAREDRQRDLAPGQAGPSKPDPADGVS